MKIVKILLLIIITASASAGATWYFTDNYYKNLEIPILTIKRSTDSERLFDADSTICQPNKKNGSCSKVVEDVYYLTFNEVTASCNNYWQAQIPKLQPQQVIVRPQAPRMNITNCNETYLGYSCYSY